jgi:hypothetical protein
LCNRSRTIANIIGPLRLAVEEGVDGAPDPVAGAVQQQAMVLRRQRQQRAGLPGAGALDVEQDDDRTLPGREHDAER